MSTLSQQAISQRMTRPMDLGASRVANHAVNLTRARKLLWSVSGCAMLILASLTSIVGCNRSEKNSKPATFDTRAKRPDVLPVMLNKDLPFRYPPTLYAEKVQGNVTLRIYIDENGDVVNDSTQVVESSNTPLLDSAAVRGSRDLKFVPAKLHNAPMPVAILFPVYFRHPEVKPPPGDTVLNPSLAPDGPSADITDTLRKK